MLLQPAWLSHQIRNASGNGGGVLVGYMPVQVVSYGCPYKTEVSHALRLKIYQTRPVALLQRKRNLCTSKGKYIKRF
jgi:hypothetical protein